MVIIMSNHSYQFSPYSDGLRAGQLGFDSRKKQDLSLLRSSHTASGAHLISYPVATGEGLPE
jgi:hypothetical protein